MRPGQPLRAEEKRLTRPGSAVRAAAQVVAIQGRYAAAGIGLAEAALAGAAVCRPLRHYPANDVIDRENRSQFYYHAHDSRRRPTQEHGHFHLFVRGDAGAEVFHLAALSLDARGWPLRWFATNRWVTGEQWVDAETAIAALPAFRPKATGRLAPIAAWLGAMTELYADAIALLLRRRDAIMSRRARGTPPEVLFEDRRLDVVAQVRVSLPERLSKVAAFAQIRNPKPSMGDPQ